VFKALLAASLGVRPLWGQTPIHPYSHVLDTAQHEVDNFLIMGYASPIVFRLAKKEGDYGFEGSARGVVARFVYRFSPAHL